MSKKSRRRNKKLLMLAALAGGAALMGKRGTAQGVSGADKAKFTSDAAYSPAPVTHPNEAIAKAKADAASDGSYKFYPRVHGGTLINQRKDIPGFGTANYPGANAYNPYQNIKGRIDRAKGGSAKKAKVTGIAKRGFGRALMKGKK